MKEFGKKHTGQANLPQEVVMKDMSKNSYAKSEDIDDTMENIDSICKRSDSQLKKHKSYQK